MGVPVDLTAARAWYEKAAASGSQEAGKLLSKLPRAAGSKK
jgi:TPR repeat protein